MNRGSLIKAVVVYESLWGNTAAIARAIAEGIGPDAVALATDAVPAEMVADADLIVAGAPVIGFRLPSSESRDSVARSGAHAPTPPDLSHPSLRSWLESLPAGRGHYAAFETRIWWSPRGATGDIERLFDSTGYRRVAKPQKFVVTDKYGPLREGELERARRWGEELAQVGRGLIDTSSGAGDACEGDSVARPRLGIPMACHLVCQPPGGVLAHGSHHRSMGAIRRKSFNDPDARARPSARGDSDR